MLQSKSLTSLFFKPLKNLTFSILILVAASTGAFAQTLSIMPIGDSITVGVDYTTHSSGGYRDPLYTDLLSEDGITAQYIGATNTSPTPLLTATGNTFHNGYGSYHIQDITDNLDGSEQPVGDGNQGGYWLTGGNGTGRTAEDPSIALLEIGTNDFLQQQQNGIDDRLTTLITTFHNLDPNTIILVAGCIPIDNNPGFNAEISTYDNWIKTTLVPSLSYTRYVDLYDDFILPGTTNTDSALYGGAAEADGIHPDETGYQVMAQTWADAIDQVETPEPAPVSLFLMALLGLGIWTRMRPARS